MTDDDFTSDQDDAGDPVEVLTRYCAAHDWPHEPIGDDEVVAQVQGSWTNYEMRGVWRDDDGVLQILLFPDIKLIDERRGAIFEGLALINEQMWMGHFEHWSSGGIILYRHAVLLGDEAALSVEMCNTLVQTAIDECERFYPVFQFMLWGGKSPTEAIAAALIETRGEA